MREIKSAEVVTEPVRSTAEDVQARYDAAMAARAEKLAAKAAANKTQSQLQELTDLEALERLEAEHGDALAVVDTERGKVVLKRATQPAYRALQNALAKGDSKIDNWVNFFNFVRPCLLHPEPAEFDLLLKELPIVLFRSSKAITELMGAEAEDAAKK